MPDDDAFATAAGTCRTLTPKPLCNVHVPLVARRAEPKAHEDRRWSRGCQRDIDCLFA